jgi:hypothetical protein
MKPGTRLSPIAIEAPMHWGFLLAFASPCDWVGEILRGVFSMVGGLSVPGIIFFWCFDYFSGRFLSFFLYHGR